MSEKIKEVEHALDYILCRLDSDETNCEVQKERNKLERCLKCNVPKSITILEQFIVNYKKLSEKCSQLEAIKYLKNYCEYDAEYDTDGLKPYYIDHSKYGIENAYKKSVDVLEQMCAELELYKKALNIVNTKLGRGYKDSYYLDLANKELLKQEEGKQQNA